MTKDEALKLALDWFMCYAEGSMSRNNAENLADEIVDDIKAALAQPEQEPVAWLMYKGEHKESFWLDKGDAYNFEMTPEHRWEPLYTTPPAQPAPVPDAIGPNEDELPAYAAGWNDCRSLMLEMRKP
jgi:hypothetical protein